MRHATALPHTRRVVTHLAHHRWAVERQHEPAHLAARAQVVTPDPSPPSFDNQQGVVPVYNLDPELPTFASGHVDDPTAFPETTVRVHNEKGFWPNQNFWLSIRIRQQDFGIAVIPEAGYAQMGLIAPGGDAIYTLRFPPGVSSRVEFEVDGSTDEAVMLTLLQFALEAGFTAADLTGLGDHDAEIGLELVQVIAEQYLADLPTLVPCANAVAAVQRGVDEQEQFTRDLQGCLESPVWQASVDQVLTRVAERDWFQQSLNLAGKAVPELGVTLKSIKAAQFAVKAWGMYQKFHPEVPGAMVGSVAFLSVDTTAQETPGAAPAVPQLSVYEVLGRAQVAIEDAGTYRYQTVTIDSAEQESSGFGEVDINTGYTWRNADSDEVHYFVMPDGKMYVRLPDGTWEDRRPPTIIPAEPLVALLGTRAPDWTLLGVEPIDGQQAYVIQRTYEYKGLEKTETLWIDSTTFLPLKLLEKYGQDATSGTEKVYSDFGALVDVEVPEEALRSSPALAEPAPDSSTDPTLEAAEIKRRTLQAIEQASTFRFVTFDLTSGRTVAATGEINLNQGMSFVTPDISHYELDEVIYRKAPPWTQAADGSWVAAGEGSWSISENDGPPYRSGVNTEHGAILLRTLQDFRGDSAEWTLRGIESVDGNRAYAIHNTQTNCGVDGCWTEDQVLWVDASTFLPIKFSYPMQWAVDEDPQIYETVYLDFGAPIDIVPPPEALAPTPTPDPLTADSPQAVAEGLLQALMASDLDAVRGYFAPDRQPEMWVQVFSFSNWTPSADTEAVVEVSTLLAWCQGVDYTVVERQAVRSGVPLAEVVFTFSTDCTTSVRLISWPSNYDVLATNQVVIPFEASTGRWYVDGAVRVVEPN